MANAEHPVIVLSAPSGAGKTTIADHLVDHLPARFAVSATTRDRRPGEEHGEHYYFYSLAEFEELIADDKLLEYEEVHKDTYYGTLRSEVEHGDQPVILDIDVKGGVNVKDLYGGTALLLFISPPSLQVLEKRLRRRGSHSEDDIRRRLERAEMEMSYQEHYDEVIVNDDLESAVENAIQTVNEFITTEG